jgi:hypothetical protein
MDKRLTAATPVFRDDARAWITSKTQPANLTTGF